MLAVSPFRPYSNAPQGWGRPALRTAGRPCFSKIFRSRQEVTLHILRSGSRFRRPLPSTGTGFVISVMSNLRQSSLPGLPAHLYTRGCNDLLLSSSTRQGATEPNERGNVEAKTIVVTGATSGIGFYTARDLRP